MIQIITYDTSKYKEYPKTVYKISQLGEIQALDDFEICIIDLSSNNLWKNDGPNPNDINSRNDLLTLKEAIHNKKKSKILIILPQNIPFYYNYIYKRNGEYKFEKSIQIKDNKNNVVEIIRRFLFELCDFEISYEKTNTEIDNTLIKADFNFTDIKNINFEPITFSNNSNKITTIKNKDTFITTLNLSEKEENINKFIDMYCKKDEKEEKPEWINNIRFFNDEQLSQEKSENIKKIEKLEEENKKLDKQLKKNLEYKSILYTNSDELVKVVLEILDEILEYDSSGFKDEKKEDFLIKKEDVTFVGEIKGLSSAVKNDNVSQLEIHIQRYFDKLQEEGKEENVKGLLIINHQRNKPLEERQKVHQNQIDLATKYGVLIVETSTLLKIYEKYKLGKFTKEECKKLFVNNIGLIKM